MTYKATLGTTSTLITIGTSILLMAILGFSFYRTMFSNHLVESIIFLCVTIGILALYLFTYLYRPTRYVVDDKRITIKRPVRDVIIPMNEIRNAFLVKKESMGWRERVGGNGGVFGFYGNFRNNFGTMTWYATKLKNYVMIETLNDGKIIVTPDKTDMVREIRRIIGK